MVVRFFFVVSLEVAVVQAVGFFGLVAPLLGCDSFFVVRYGLSSFGKMLGVGFSLSFFGVNLVLHLVLCRCSLLIVGVRGRILV